MTLMSHEHASGKRRKTGKLTAFVLVLVVFLFTACSDSLENNIDEIPPADDAVTESTPPPTLAPTTAPTLEPTEAPTPEPTVEPTSEPTAAPTPEPTAEPTAAPTPEPTAVPTPEPTAEPTAAPTPEPAAAPSPEPTVEPAPEPAPAPAPNIDSSSNTDELTYVLNTNTHKIHHPNCKSVAKIKAENYATTNKSLDDLLGEGYTKCGNCWK